MEGFIVFVLILGGIAWLLRYLRQREIDRFRDADMGDFRSFSMQQEIREKQEAHDPVLAKAQAFAALNPDKVSPPQADPVEATEPATGFDEDVPPPVLFTGKNSLFDEITRNLLQRLAEVLPSHLLILTDVPLSELATSDGASADDSFRLSTTRVSYVLVDVRTVTPVCGIQHQDQAGQSFARSVFNDVGIPLVEFPLSSDVSAFEVKEKLGPIIEKR